MSFKASFVENSVRSSPQPVGTNGILQSKNEDVVKALKKFFRGQDVEKDQPDVDKKKQDAGTNLVAVQVCQCLFCPKIFGHSKYLIKHILRRHAELLQLKFQPKESSRTSKALEQFGKDFEDFKELLESRLSEISKHVEPLKTLNIENLNENHMHRSESHRSSRRSKELVRDKEKKCECAGVKQSVMSLESQGIKTMSSLDTVSSRLYLNENQVKSISSEVVAIRNSLSHHDMMLELLREQNELIVSSNKDTCDQLMSLKLITSDFDNKIQQIVSLLQNSFKENNQAMYQIEERLKFFLQGYCDKILKMHAPKISKVESASSFISDSDSSAKNMEPVDVEDSLDIDEKDVQQQLHENIDLNIRNLNIKSGTSRLSDAEYDIKFRRIRGLAQQMSKVYKNFGEVRSSIEHAVNEKVHLLVKRSDSTKLDSRNSRELENGLESESEYSHEVNGHQTFAFDISKLSSDCNDTVPSISVTKPTETAARKPRKKLSFSNDSSSLSSEKSYHSMASTASNSTRSDVTEKKSVKSETVTRKNIKRVTYDTGHLGHSCSNDTMHSKHATDISLESASSLQSLSSWES